jgi:hypothetical protein
MNAVLSLLWISFSLAVGGGFVMAAKDDITGDGVKEDISIVPDADSSGFLLTVNSSKIKGKLSNGPVDGFQIVDVLADDGFKEIAVHTSGPSDDDQYIVYRFNGSTITQLAMFERWPKFLGNGIVYVDDWMGFWKKREKYQLDQAKNQILIVPQQYYFVGIDIKINKSFPIYKYYEKYNKTAVAKPVIANLKETTTATILLYAPLPTTKNGGETPEWYLIKSESGLLGWAPLSSFIDKVDGLTLAD